MAAWKLRQVLLLDKLITTTAKENPLKTTIATDSSKTRKKNQNKIHKKYKEIKEATEDTITTKQKAKNNR
jgi:hypothetical protein